MSPPANLLIFGASARAAAFSALRAGLRPWCADLFADVDLQQRCPALRLPGRYPQGFLNLAARALPGPWMYTGALENWPKLIRRIAQRRLLWGNDWDALALVRNPTIVANCLTAAGLPVPATHRSLREQPPPGSWLVKPLHGAGGNGIRFWGEERAPLFQWDRFYLQEYVEGDPCSALYAGVEGRIRFLGMTRQLIGKHWLHAAPFHYCGSIGPLFPGPGLLHNLERLGTALADVHGLGGRMGSLRGLFGIDGVLRDGVFWPVEVNPRYTASVEVLEYATGLRALDWHRKAFEPAAPTPDLPAASPASFVGKAILFARQDLSFPRTGPWDTVPRSPLPPLEMPAFADIPAAGQPIQAGKPILTFFSRADSESGCEDLLRQIAADLDGYLS